MKNNTTWLRGLILFLLLFNGIGALYGGYHLMTDPTGSSLGLPFEFLDDTPFISYYLPGLVLFICNGIFSLLVAACVLFKVAKSGWLVIAQGAVLIGWLGVQMITLQVIYYLQFVLGVVGLLLILTGMMLNHQKT